MQRNSRTAVVNSVSWAARWIGLNRDREGINDDGGINRNGANRDWGRKREGCSRDNDAHAAKAVRWKSKGINLGVCYLQACMEQCRHSLLEHHGEEDGR